MKLYFAPGACSFSPHIVLRELGLPFDLVQVDLRSKATSDGRDFRAINPKGYVPTLELDDGRILTEGPAIVQYLADRKPEAGLAPANGTFERYQLQEWLNFISAELHKQFSPLFNPATPDSVRQQQIEKLGGRFTEISVVLGKQDYLLAGGFSVADAYLYTVLVWTRFVGVDLAPWPVLVRYMQRMEARPSVQAAQLAERDAKKI